MKRFGLVGGRLGHSFSKSYFEQKCAVLGLDDCCYSLFEIPSVEGLREWVRREGVSGFNVTAPYKVSVVAQLDGLDALAREIGAVNCVSVEDGRLIGHNTDAPAFAQTIEDEKFACAFVLGTGGAARAVAYALEQKGIPYRFVSRHPDRHANTIGYDQLPTSQPLNLSTLIVNATPVGMFPDAGRSPLDLSLLSSRLPPSALVYDLVYNPSPTLFLRQAAALGARVKDGLEMLHRQADLSWEFFKVNGL